MSSTCLIYALGSGWGHLNRAIALGRSLVAYGPVYILSNSPYAAQVQAFVAAIPDLYLQVLPPGMEVDTVRHQVGDWLKALPCGRLIVDTFPRGLVGELASLVPELGDRRPVLIHRDLNPRYVASHHLLNFVQTHYTRLWVPGEGMAVPFAALPQTRHSAPWLVCYSQDLCDRPTATARLGLQREEPLPRVLILGSGQPQEQAFFGAVGEAIAQVMPQVAVDLLTAEPPGERLSIPWTSYYPAMEVLSVADVVVGGGGYNTVHECGALNVPLVAVPWKRLYDRQALRLKRKQQEGQAIAIVRSVEETIAAVQHWLASSPQPSRSFPPTFENGAGTAEVLQDLLHKS